MLQSVPEAKGVLHSVVATLYGQLGCNSQEPGEELTPRLIEVLTEGGHFVKISELAETEGKEVVGVDVSFDTYQLSVFTNMHTSTQYQKTDWCCLIPVSEFELMGRDDHWGPLENVVSSLPMMHDDAYVQTTLKKEGQNWNITIEIWKIGSDRRSLYGFLPEKWRFRAKRDEPTVFVPRQPDEIIHYVQVFF